MRLRYLSDLHLEFIGEDINTFINKIKGNKDEILILAGDIGNPYKEHYSLFMNYISNNFKKTFIICGNHEYYHNGKSVYEINDYLEEYFKKWNNITFLNNNYEWYENYCFIGTTLWSKITNPKYTINDINYIHNLNCEIYNKLNDNSVNFLETILSKNDYNKNCIIITHHLPSNSFIDAKYKNSILLPYNQWFYCNLDNLIKNYNKKIKIWFYGHTHKANKEIKDDIQFICNPIGYPGENIFMDLENNYIDI